MKPTSSPILDSKKLNRRPLGIMPILAVTAALWGCSANAAPSARPSHKNAHFATTQPSAVPPSAQI